MVDRRRKQRPRRYAPLGTSERLLRCRTPRGSAQDGLKIALRVFMKENSAEANARIEPMTSTQAARLEALCAEVGEAFESKLSKAEATKRIERLEAKRGRGESALDGGDGGSSIRRNEAPPEDQTGGR